MLALRAEHSRSPVSEGTVDLRRVWHLRHGSFGSWPCTTAGGLTARHARSGAATTMSDCWVHCLETKTPLFARRRHARLAGRRLLPRVLPWPRGLRLRRLLHHWSSCTHNRSMTRDDHSKSLCSRSNYCSAFK